MPASTPRETDLYPPVKALLEEQGYEVKSEVDGADVVGVRDGEDPVIVELKTGFALTLFHQAVARQAVTDAVYVAVPRGSGRRFQAALKNNLVLCRRLGLGLMTVRLSDGHLEIHADPEPYRPRRSHRRKRRLLREFARRVGDPNQGGATPRAWVTAYRQDALKIARYLAANGPTKGSKVAAATEVARATRVMADDHYGWFERVSTGVYQLAPKGEAALGQYAS